MQLANEEQALFAVDVIQLIRAHQQYWWHQLNSRQRSLRLPEGQLPYSPWSRPSIWDVAVVTEALLRTHANDLLCAVMWQKEGAGL